MKRKQSIAIGVWCGLILTACAPVKEFKNTPAYQGHNEYTYELSSYDPARKTVVIVANNNGTEMFDMMAPFYLFNATGKANVYIVAKDKYPVTVKKGIFVLPQSTFAEIDSLQIKPDVIVIPFLSIADSVHQDPVIVKWIREKFTASTIILSICDGAATAAATGLYDGKPITAHASDFNGIKKYFSKPNWVQDVSVTRDGNLYSTAGVSNATDGSLVIIQRLFGTDVMNGVKQEVYYTGQYPGTDHQSNSLRFSDEMRIVRKIMLKKNKRVGVLLQNDINEFRLAAVMDTYNRTFPASIKSFSFNDSAVRSKYGLTIIPTGRWNQGKLDEIHVMQPAITSGLKGAAKLVTYDSTQRQYIIDECLQRINDQYGKKYGGIVKLMLDYN